MIGKYFVTLIGITCLVAMSACGGDSGSKDTSTQKDAPGITDPGPVQDPGAPPEDTGKDAAGDLVTETGGDVVIGPQIVQIGPEEAKDIALPGGGVLHIPWGAVDDTVTITITPIAAPESDLFAAVGPFYRFEPAGLVFQRSATIDIPYLTGGIESPKDSRFVVAWKEDGGQWQALHTTVVLAGGMVRAPVAGFSEGGPGYWGEEPPSCEDPTDCADPAPDDCWNTDCVGGQCVEVAVEAETPCNTHSQCVFSGHCDEEGECKGVHKVCNNPPGPKACYKSQCNAATGLCEYSLDGECGVDKDCPGTQSCINCKCSNCTTDNDCGADDPLPCDSSIKCVDGKCETKIKAVGTPCTNESLCDINDKCDAVGLCVGTPKPCNSPPGPAECYEDGDCWNDETGECDYDLNGECGVDTDCYPGQTCESCQCVDPECYKDKDCTDDDPLDCYRFECEEYACKKVEDFKMPCDDNDACTEDDHCHGAGGCYGSPKACDTPPNEPKECYTGECMDQQTGECVYSLAFECATADDCPGNKICVACKCEAECTKDEDCPDDNPNDCLVPWCIMEECDTKLLDVGAPCDDGDPCTQNDHCSELWDCWGNEPTVCDQPPADPSCHVVPGTCDEGCQYEKKPVGTECGDQIGECYQPRCDADAKCVNDFICPAATTPCMIAVCVDMQCWEDKDPAVECAYNIDCSTGQECNTSTCKCEQVGDDKCGCTCEEFGMNCVASPPGTTFTPVSGCEGWSDADQCSGWYSVVHESGSDPNAKYPDGKTFMAYGCTIEINCPK